MVKILTPMMRQYRQVKSKLPKDTILFFRLGDFYEMFFEDAVEASQILDITLTKRNKVPMCGVPYHASESYLAKLIRSGKKVAVCDQVEEPSASKGIVRREITSIVTPGAILSDGILQTGCHNYLASLYQAGGVIGVAFIDISTGTFWSEETQDADNVRDNLLRFSPTECVIPSEAGKSSDSILHAILSQCQSLVISPYDDWIFEYDTASETLLNHFGVHSLDGFGIENRPAIVGAAGGVLHYVKSALHRNLEHVKKLRIKNPANFLVMDEATRANLDLVISRGLSWSSTDSGRAKTMPGGTLLSVLDNTKTPMGARQLREWILAPLARLNAINRRHDIVEAFYANRSLLRDLRKSLEQIRDIERLIARLGAGTGNARDAWALSQSLALLPNIHDILQGSANRKLAAMAKQILLFPKLVKLIKSAITDNPPVSLKEGGIIRKGYKRQLDELYEAATQAKNWLAEYQAKEQKQTGIKTLKVRHNKIFGYYIEVSKAQSVNVPVQYARKQTLVNAERYITPELKEYENKVLGAQERAIALEYDLFNEIRGVIINETTRIQNSAEVIAKLDALASLADRALSLNYVRPIMTENDRIEIKEGRHPVIEQIPGADRFVPNDALLDTARNRLIIITGPNMAGKSTYIRQVALIVIMAQIGSFVPAKEAKIGLVDRIFTRVGASDDLVRGRSTFMVEMQETANILNNATEKSLIILDEIGRGTSTFDGISIAWAVAEHLHNKICAKTMFATHYHELTDLALTLPSAKNYNALAREHGDSVVFLRKIVPGGSDKSYGIHVARFAGLPDEVINRAKEILLNLEEGEFGEAGQPKIATHRPRKDKKSSAQLSLFEHLP